MAFSGTIIWSNTVAQNIYVTQTNLITSGPINGVMSCGLLDVLYYDSENYRDDFTSSVYPGNGTISSGQNIPASALFSYPNSVINNAAVIISTQGDGTTPPATQAVDSSTLIASDSTLHVAPRFEQKKQTLRLFFSGADCTGNLLYDCPEDQFRGMSTAQFTFIS